MALDYKSFKSTQARGNKGEEPEKNWVKWTKFCVVTVLYLLFLYWVESWIGLIVVPFIYDIYISQKIHWTWWKNLESDMSRTIMSWVDAIVFALIAVYFVNQFFFQNYQIPSSSLEKSLMTGDYLLVSKISYGPRIPQTPLTMPLTQHTMPLFGCKSYIEWPQWNYRRVKGLGKVEQGDIVVFNFPAGDTVAVENPTTFYNICLSLDASYRNENGLEVPDFRKLSVQEQRKVYEQMYMEGKAMVAANSAYYGDIVVRPTDRRENYVKRCVGLPGQKFEIKNKVIYTDGKPMAQPENVQFNYVVYFKNGMYLNDDLSNELGISDEDRRMRSLGYMPLTRKALEGLKKSGLTDSIVPIIDNNFTNDVNPVCHINNMVYPLNHDYGWTCDNYGPIIIPAKGMTLKLDAENIAIYERPIRTYEGNDLRVDGDKIYINGELATSYTFKMDYYWMMGDNRHNSADSRYWGFVPEDHIVGKPLFIWLSISPDANPSSRVRWNRIFKWVADIK
ncbi:MAG: S26 family signal peptidase [Bacteroidaceae bacterium]|nr:S26 family signal peptidase [Bacteroidaceae bacterium]